MRPILVNVTTPSLRRSCKRARWSMDRSKSRCCSAMVMSIPVRNRSLALVARPHPPNACPSRAAPCRRSPGWPQARRQVGWLGRGVRRPAAPRPTGRPPRSDAVDHNRPAPRAPPSAAGSCAPRDRSAQPHKLANRRFKPPNSDALPPALQVVAAAKEVSHPDTRSSARRSSSTNSNGALCGIENPSRNVSADRVGQSITS
jgi:hypothetical protein